MAIAYVQPRYNGYSYVPSSDVFSELTDTLTAKLRADVGPGEDGGFTAGGQIAPRRFSVKGQVGDATAATVARLRALLDNLYLIHQPGLPQPFWLNSDRYINAEPESCGIISFKKPAVLADYEVAFLASDPFFYAGDPANPYTPLVSSANLNVGGASPPAANTSGLTTPTTAPTIAAHAAATALAAGTYDVACSYRDLAGETQISPIASVVLTAGQRIDVTAVALPDTAEVINWYCSIAANSATLAWQSANNGSAFSITALPTATGSTVVTPAGTVYSRPIITIPVATAPVSGIVYVSVGSFSFIFQPPGTGSFVIDCTKDQEEVTLAGVDETAYFQGVFPKLAAAANTILVGVSGGAVLGTPTVAWQDRWLTP